MRPRAFPSLLVHLSFPSLAKFGPWAHWLAHWLVLCLKISSLSVFTNTWNPVFWFLLENGQVWHTGPSQSQLAELRVSCALEPGRTLHSPQASAPGNLPRLCDLPDPYSVWVCEFWFKAGRLHCDCWPVRRVPPCGAVLGTGSLASFSLYETPGACPTRVRMTTKSLGTSPPVKNHWFRQITKPIFLGQFGGELFKGWSWGIFIMCLYYIGLSFTLWRHIVEFCTQPNFKVPEMFQTSPCTEFGENIWEEKVIKTQSFHLRNRNVEMPWLQVVSEVKAFPNYTHIKGTISNSCMKRLNKSLE